MKPTVLPAAVIAWLKNQGAELLQAGKGTAPGPASALLEVGKVYEAQVLQKLPQGRHLVQVGEQPMSMTLPGQNKPGDAVKLLYLRAEPRPTFMLVRPEPAAGERNVQVSEAATRVASLARWSGPPPLPPAPTTTPAAAQAATAGPAAAPAAQMLAQQAAMPTAAGRPAAVAQVAATVLAGAPTAAAQTMAVPANPLAPVAARLQLAQALDATQAARVATRAGVPILEQPATQGQAWLAPLKQAVKDSGVFYEANLSRWVRGEQPLSEIQRQPQARLADPALAAQGTRVAELDGMPEEVARLAGRQLHMLEGQPFLWQGLAWPGQRMDWLIEERPGGEGGEEEAPQWQTELRLSLPQLGGVAAEIVLQPRGLKLRLAAENPETEARMREALPELVGRLDAAGVAVLGLMVEASAASSSDDEPPTAG